MHKSLEKRAFFLQINNDMNKTLFQFEIKKQTTFKCLNSNKLWIF